MCSQASGPFALQLVLGEVHFEVEGMEDTIFDHM